MCLKRKKENKNKKPLKSLSREEYYSIITQSISKYIEKTNNSKIFFQKIIGGVTMILIMAMTVAYITLIYFVLQYSSDNKLNDVSVITTIITSSTTYAVSLIGTLSIVVKYMFNKNDLNDNTNLIKSFLDSDAAKNTTPVSEKTISEIADSSEIDELFASSNNIIKNDNNH